MANQPNATPTVHPQIVRVEGILGREPVIRGTRTPVRAIVEYSRFGLNPAEIQYRLPYLSLPQVLAALAYYQDHPDEIEFHIRRNKIPEHLLWQPKKKVPPKP